MSNRIAALLIVVLFCAGWPSVNLGGGVVAAASGPTDFTADSRLLGCWVMASGASPTEAATEADNCTTDATDNMAHQGTYASAASVPAGSSQSASLDLSGAGTDYMQVADATKWESIDFTAGCWGNIDNVALNQTIFGKSWFAEWQIEMRSAGPDWQVCLEGTCDQTATAAAAGTWQHIVARHNATTAEVEIFLNGEPDGSPFVASAVVDFDGTQAVRIGANNVPSGLFNGQVFECFYASDDLTDEEICEIYLNGLDGSADSTTRSSTYGACS